MTLQTGSSWISLTADYLIADTALPEQLMNDANLWLDQARTLLRLTLQEADVEGDPAVPADVPRQGLEGLDRLLDMAQGCVSQAHRQLLRRQLDDRRD